jgi:DNA processing protein
MLEKSPNENWHTEALLSLLQTKGIGRKTIQTFLTSLQDKSRNIQFPSNLEELHDTVVNLEKIAKQEKKPYKLPRDFSLDEGNKKAKEILKESEEQNIQVIDWLSNLFPESLKQIPDPPVILYAKGNSSILRAADSIAVIGTRDPTEYGRYISHHLGYRLAANGITVVGGLAKGCDIAAHQGCLDANGQTIAVLAHGLDSIYPRSNENVAKQIVHTGGCLVSEYEPGVKASRYHFVDRDRLQSGLSKSVIVAETREKGGTMHTAGFAVKQERALGVVHFPQDKATAEQQKGYERLIFEFNAVSINAENDDELDQFIFAINNSLPVLYEKPRNQSSIFNW